MKRLFLPLILVARLASADDIDVRSFEYLDVIETSDGSVWKGVVVEQTPNVQYKIAIAGGSVHVVKASDVVKMSKQRNLELRTAPVQATPTEAGVSATYERKRGLPPPLADSGLRLDPEVAIVFASRQDNLSSVAPTLRIGYEAVFGNFSFEGGGQSRFTYWLDANDTWTLETMAYGRAGFHISRVATYVGLASGLDTTFMHDDGTIAFGMNLQTSVEILASRAVGFRLGFDYHPNISGIEYFALALGASFHL